LVIGGSVGIRNAMRRHETLAGALGQTRTGTPCGGGF
jgi:hypothetical protein